MSQPITPRVMALLVATIVAVSPVSAQVDHWSCWAMPEAQAIVTRVPDADHSFGQHITFYLEASSQAPIIAIDLAFRVQGQTDTTVVPMLLEPASQISVEYPHSLVGQDIPPFASITYWWEVRDEAGGSQRSEEKLFHYADNRYEWQARGSEQLDVNWEVYWVTGDVVFGQTALNVAVKALDEIRREFRTTVPDVVRIYIYPSEEDLRSALNLAGYDWAGGQARPELGAILIGIPNSLSAPDEMERFIPHELTHLLVYEAAGRTLGRVPPWLDEGLATLNEFRPDPDREALLEQALAQDRLLPLEALCAPFPADESAARLAYAQSASVVHYLREEYGSQAIRDLLAVYADNASCEAGVTRTLGKSLKGLDSAWRADLAQRGQIIVALQDSAVWLALWILTVLLALPFLGVVRRSGRNG
jgi:hypothetical protein